MRAGERASEFDEVRRTMALRHFKWDAQVGDVDALASFPLLLSRDEWNELSRAAESLTREMIDAEMCIVENHRASKLIGVPRTIQPFLRGLMNDATPAIGRIVRFDFHPTREGWRISEANSDVPGGFTEASSFTKMMAEKFDREMTGDPARAWLDVIAHRANVVALLVSPGWIEDAQVVAYLESGLRDRRCNVRIVAPHQLRWSNGFAYADERIDAIVRFHQIEWLAALPKTLQWNHFFVHGKTLVGNPGIAIVSESKRFPIACAAIDLSMPTWRAFLPETRDARDVSWNHDEWILKGTFGNTGDDVLLRSDMSTLAWARAMLRAKVDPKRWVAQRRFDSIAIETPDGPRHVCLGVYTVDGVAAGAYARLSS